MSLRRVSQWLTRLQIAESDSLCRLDGDLLRSSKFKFRTCVYLFIDAYKPLLDCLASTIKSKIDLTRR